MGAHRTKESFEPIEHLQAAVEALDLEIDTLRRADCNSRQRLIAALEHRRAAMDARLRRLRIAEQRHRAS